MNAFMYTISTFWDKLVEVLDGIFESNMWGK